MSYRAENNGVVLLVQNVNLTTLTDVIIGTVPPGVSFACTGALVISETFSGIVTPPTISIGTGVAANNMFTPTSIVFTGANQTKQLAPIAITCPTVGTGVSVLAKITLTVATTLTAQIAVFGYYF